MSPTEISVNQFIHLIGLPHAPLLVDALLPLKAAMTLSEALYRRHRDAGDETHNRPSANATV